MFLVSNVRLWRISNLRHVSRWDPRFSNTKRRNVKFLQTLIKRLHFLDLPDFAYIHECKVGGIVKFLQSIILRLHFLNRTLFYYIHIRTQNWYRIVKLLQAFILRLHFFDLTNFSYIHECKVGRSARLLQVLHFVNFYIILLCRRMQSW